MASALIRTYNNTDPYQTNTLLFLLPTVYDVFFLCQTYMHTLSRKSITLNICGVIYQFLSFSITHLFLFFSFHFLLPQVHGCEGHGCEVCGSEGRGCEVHAVRCMAVRGML